jgi:hypothetical protein
MCKKRGRDVGRKDDFDAMPGLEAVAFRDLAEGTVIRLLTVEYVRSDEVPAPAIIFDVEYVHTRFEYRTPGEKDAVAYGKARVHDSARFQDVRIFFSKPSGTASIRGLAVGGQVKLRLIERRGR